MYTLVFELEGEGPRPGLVIAQHLPVVHEELEKDPFTIAVGNRYVATGYVCVIPFIFHWWPEDEDIAVKREAFHDDWTVADAYAWLGACYLDFKASILFYGGRVQVGYADAGTPPIELAGQIPCPVMGALAMRTKGLRPQMSTIMKQH